MKKLNIRGWEVRYLPEKFEYIVEASTPIKIGQRLKISLPKELCDEAQTDFRNIIKVVVPGRSRPFTIPSARIYEIAEKEGDLLYFTLPKMMEYPREKKGPKPRQLEFPGKPPPVGTQYMNEAGEKLPF